ncbi:MAG: hypothetical protein IJF59_03855 [Clostridia bacterium]|nr:hypothetical protein [Clostridia bacterium]
MKRFLKALTGPALCLAAAGLLCLSGCADPSPFGTVSTTRMHVRDGVTWRARRSKLPLVPTFQEGANAVLTEQIIWEAAHGDVSRHPAFWQAGNWLEGLSIDLLGITGIDRNTMESRLAEGLRYDTPAEP